MKLDMFSANLVVIVLLLLKLKNIEMDWWLVFMPYGALLAFTFMIFVISKTCDVKIKRE